RLQSLAEETQPAAHVEHCPVPDDLVGEELVHERLDPTARVVARKRRSEPIPEPFVNEFLVGRHSHRGSLPMRTACTRDLAPKSAPGPVSSSPGARMDRSRPVSPPPARDVARLLAAAA